MLPLIANGGRFYAQRGKNFLKDIKDSENKIIELGGYIERIVENDIVIIAKNKETPTQYPRSWKNIK